MSIHDNVTIVITNYNYARFLPDAVASALNQHGGAPNVIIVDDGSTEAGTDAVLESLSGQVHVIRQPNMGLSAARNAGLRIATTPYLMVLDADDKLTPTALSSLKPLLENDPKLGFSYGITRFFGDWQGIMTMPPYDPYKLLYRHMIGSTALMRADVFADTGGFDPEIRGFEDWDFWLHALKLGWRGRRVEDETFLYRRHGATMVTQARKDYHHWYGVLRQKHADLYRGEGKLARETGASRFEQLVYKWFWGKRIVPARVEQTLYSLIWRGAKA